MTRLWDRKRTFCVWHSVAHQLTLVQVLLCFVFLQHRLVVLTVWRGNKVWSELHRFKRHTVKKILCLINSEQRPVRYSQRMMCTCCVSHVHHRVHVSWTDWDGDISLCWYILKQLCRARLHAVHEGDGVFTVHVVHNVEVTHFILRGPPGNRDTHIHQSVMIYLQGEHLHPETDHIHKLPDETLRGKNSFVWSFLWNQGFVMRDQQLRLPLLWALWVLFHRICQDRFANNM